MGPHLLGELPSTRWEHPVSEGCPAGSRAGQPSFCWLRKKCLLQQLSCVSSLGLLPPWAHVWERAREVSIGRELPGPNGRMGRRGGKACCWWLRVSKRWMSPAGSWNQEALPGTFPSFPLLDSKVQDAKMHRPNSGCFLELHKLLGLTWAGQNKTTEEPVRIQWLMYSPGYADGCFDWWLDQVFVTNNLLLFLTIKNTLLQSGKKKKRIFAGCSFKT